MATHAFTACREGQTSVRYVDGLRIHVTLETKESTLAAEKHVPLNRSMGTVAASTTFDFYRRVFVNEGAALFDVAADAYFKVHLL